VPITGTPAPPGSGPPAPPQQSQDEDGPQWRID
jgi:hypothetical protein